MADGTVIDKALVLTFGSPASFTGDDVVEFQTHGSPAVVKALLRTLSDRKDCRLANPGEFTRRALENNQLDLAQVEGLADLIDAETEYQRKQALDAFSGALKYQVQDWRKRLIRALGLIELTIDFVDEEVPDDVTVEVVSIIDELQDEIVQALAGVSTAERIRTGFEVAIIGSPNVGKSTLLNYLAGREAAITSEVAGTTRDVIEVRMDLEGIPVTLVDTAGIRETEDKIEQLGVERALLKAKEADLRIVLLSPGETCPIELSEDDFVIGAKSDVNGGVGISGKTGEGVPDLIAHIVAALGQRVSSSISVSRERHRISLETAQADLDIAGALIASGFDETDLLAEHVRRAVASLESLVGFVDVEHVLDEIFGSFCLGK